MPKQDAIEATMAIHDTIVAERDRTETDRRLAPAVVNALIEARLMRLMLPEQYNGWALPAVDCLRVFEKLAQAEASVAWVVWNNTLTCLFSRALSPATRETLFSDPTWMYANATRPSGKAELVENGYRISGEWSLVSGCELAQWMMLTCLVEENGSVRMTAPEVPEMRQVFIEKPGFEVLDTWHVGGLRGTGSHNIVVNDYFVPDAHTCSPADPSTWDEPIGYLPIISTLAAGFSAQLLGIAQISVETAIGLGRSKTSPGPILDMRDRSSTQVAVASHEAAVNAARLYLHSVVQAFWDKAEQHQAPSMDEITAVWAASAHGVEVARHAVDAMYEVSGTSSIYKHSRLERIHRDVRVMLQHIIAHPMWLEEVGRYKLGLEPTNPQFSA